MTFTRSYLKLFQFHVQMHVRSRWTRIDTRSSITNLDDARVPGLIRRRWNYQNAMFGIVFIVPFLLQESVRRWQSRLIRFVHCNARDPVGSGGGCGQARTAVEMTFSAGVNCCDDNWAAYTNMFTGEICAAIDDSRFQSVCFLFASRRFQSIDRFRKREKHVACLRSFLCSRPEKKASSSSSLFLHRQYLLFVLSFIEIKTTRARWNKKSWNWEEE